MSFDTFPVKTTVLLLLDDQSYKGCTSNINEHIVYIHINTWLRLRYKLQLRIKYRLDQQSAITTEPQQKILTEQRTWWISFENIYKGGNQFHIKHTRLPSLPCSRLIDWWAGCVFGVMIGQFIDWLIDWLIERLNGWCVPLIGRLITGYLENGIRWLTDWVERKKTWNTNDC